MKHFSIADLVISGIAYKKVIAYEEEQRVGNHAICKISLEMDEGFKNPAGYYNVPISVRLVSGDDTVQLFYGIIIRIRKVAEKDYPEFQFEAYSRSFLLDRKRENATYQQTTKLISQLIKQVAGGDANIFFGVTDRPVGSWIYRNQETSWQLIKRLASLCKACVMTNTNTFQPVISIGRTGKMFSGTVSLIETYRIDGVEYCRTYMPIELGTGMAGGGFVSYVKTFSKGGEIITDYVVSGEEGFKSPILYNPGTECTMLKGKVTAVDKEKIQVYFEGIDSEQDAGSDTWYEYATPFATGGGSYGSGFYCMPEEGDEVRVFIPSADESKAFAFGTVSTAQLPDPQKAQWKMPEGQELLFTDKGIRIACGDHHVYIDLLSGEGIKIWTNKSIIVDCQGGINIKADDSVIAYGQHMLQLSASETKIILEDKNIIYNSANVQLN